MNDDTAVIEDEIIEEQGAPIVDDAEELPDDVEQADDEEQEDLLTIS
jgi:hypothetical protein